MKKTLLAIVLLIASVVFVSYYNNKPETICKRFSARADSPAKQLNYRLYLFGVLPVANAVFNADELTEYKGEKVYHLSGKAETLKYLAKFFSAGGSADSYVDMQKFNPSVFKQKYSISGKPDVEKEVFYDQKANTMTASGISRQILPDTQDPLSALFNIRRMDFSKIKVFDINFNTNQKNYAIKGTVSLKETSLNGKAATLATLEGSIFRRDKNPYHKSSISMVLWKEMGNAPVLIKVFAGGILMNARLTDIK